MKFWGGVLMTLAFIFTLTIIGMSPWIIATFIGLIAAILGKTEANVTGVIIGESAIWALLIVLALVSWRYAIKFLSAVKP